MSKEYLSKIEEMAKKYSDVCYCLTVEEIRKIDIFSDSKIVERQTKNVRRFNMSYNFCRSVLERIAFIKNHL